MTAALVVDQTQALKFAWDIASGMAFLHTLEPMVARLHLNSKHVMVAHTQLHTHTNAHTRTQTHAHARTA